MFKTVFIADDHPFTVEGMERLISSTGEYEIVGKSSNGIDAIADIKRLKPDCAIIDLSMPGANGLEVFTECRKWAPETRIAVITGITSAAMFSKLVDAGVHGLFVKNSAPEEISDGIRKIINGERVIAPEIQLLLDAHAESNQLTNREIEVLQSIARGLSNAKIAERLGVSHKTIDSHRTSLMRKLNVHSTATLLVKAIKQGLVDV